MSLISSKHWSHTFFFQNMDAHNSDCFIFLHSKGTFFCLPFLVLQFFHDLRFKCSFLCLHQLDLDLPSTFCWTYKKWTTSSCARVNDIIHQVAKLNIQHISGAIKTKIVLQWHHSKIPAKFLVSEEKNNQHLQYVRIIWSKYLH